MKAVDSRTIVTAILLLTGVIFLAHGARLLAQPPLDIPDMAIPQAVNQLEIMSRPRSVHNWRKDEIRAFLEQVMPESRPFQDHELDALARGDFNSVVDFPPKFIPPIEMIGNGSPVLSLSSVGLLLRGSDSVDFEPLCTVILTKPNVVLTTRHCAANLHPEKQERFKIFFPHEGFREPAGDATLLCKDDKQKDCSISIDDLAVIELQYPYVVLPTAELGENSDSVAGANVKVSGYGYCYRNTSSSTQDLEFCGGNEVGNHGIWRQGSVKLAECTQCADSNSAQNESREICIVNDSSISELPISALSNDSGGPMFLSNGDRNNLVGVASNSQNCNTDAGVLTGKYVDVTNPAYSEWLNLEAFASGAESTSASDQWDILEEEEFLRIGAKHEESYTVSIPTGTIKLVVTLNHEVGSALVPVDIDLMMPENLNAQCIRHRGVEACTVENPTAVPIEFTVSRKDTCGIKGIPTDTECRPRGFQMAAICIGCPKSDDLDEE